MAKGYGRRCRAERGCEGARRRRKSRSGALGLVLEMNECPSAVPRRELLQGCMPQPDTPGTVRTRCKRAALHSVAGFCMRPCIVGLCAAQCSVQDNVVCSNPALKEQKETDRQGNTTSHGLQNLASSQYGLALWNTSPLIEFCFTDLHVRTPTQWVLDSLTHLSLHLCEQAKFGMMKFGIANLKWPNVTQHNLPNYAMIFEVPKPLFWVPFLCS